MPFLAALPFLMALTWLVAATLSPDAPSPSPIPLLLAELAVPAALSWSARRWNTAGASARLAARLSPCLLAPLAVTQAWTLAPGHLPGVAYGGYPFFLSWLTRYPSLGPFNGEVLAGTLCVLGASALPAAFGVYRLGAEAPRRGPAAGILALDLLAWGPVLVRLDLPLLAGAAMVARDDPGSAAVLAAGPLMRALAVAAMARDAARTWKEPVPTRSETGPAPGSAPRGH